MSLTPAQIKERLGSRYPWPLYNNVVPTVFDDCVSWEEQVLWLYRFILGVYLELQDEGYITIDEVLEDSPAAVKSSGIWKFVMDHVNALNVALDALDGKLTGQMEQLNTDLRKLVSDTADQLNRDMQALQTKIEGDMTILETNLTRQMTALDTKLTNALNAAVSKLESELEAEIARLEALIKSTKDGIDGEIATINTSITEIRNRFSALETSLGTLTDRVDTVEGDLEALTNRVEAIEILVNSLSQQLFHDEQISISSNNSVALWLRVLKTTNTAIILGLSINQTNGYLSVNGSSGAPVTVSKTGVFYRLKSTAGKFVVSGFPRLLRSTAVLPINYKIIGEADDIKTVTMWFYANDGDEGKLDHIDVLQKDFPNLDSTTSKEIRFLAPTN